MFRSASVLLLAVVLPAAAQSNFQNIGRVATPAEIAAWDIDVRADFKGLPKGSGSVKKGEQVWEAKCAACHGAFGESNAMFPPIAGGTTREDIQRGRVAALAREEQRTTLMKLSHVSTLWDYINRAMPWTAPKTLTVEEVYATTAYILNLADIVPGDFVLSDANIGEVQQRLPNRAGMTRAHGLWEVKGTPDVKARACMKNCAPEPKVTSALPAQALGTHGNLAEQNRPIGPVRGIDIAVAKNQDPSRDLAEKSGCLGCHGVTARVVGPSLSEIGAKYRTEDGAETRLAEKVISGSQGAWGNVPMPAQPHVPQSDARSLVRWILGR